MSAPALTRRSAVALAAAIRAGEVSSREVVDAHIEVLQDLQPRAGALAEDRAAAAREEADVADARIAAGGDLPPLLGVPCTVKESIGVRGMPNCAGLVARAEHRADRTAPAAQRLFDAGLICLGVTNTSEMTMWIESHNRVYGRTSNVYDPARTAGGSSGGEAAAVGGGGSPVGLGADSGGSIRVPAFFNDVFGHKPSQGLVPNTGQWPIAHGEAARMLTIGPLTRRAEDLMPVLRALAGPDGEAEQVRDVALGDPAAVALDGMAVVLSEDAWFVPFSRDLRDAGEQAAGALAAQGARVRRESLRSLRRALELYLSALSDGSPESFAELLLDAEAEQVALRRAVARVARGKGDHTWPTIVLLATERLSSLVPERRVRKAVAAGRALRHEVEGIIGDGVLLHPPHARVAPPHGRTVGRAWVLTPTAVFNLLELPATVAPLGLDRRGIPVGVQIVAGRDRDHVSIACALALERAFVGWIPPV